MSFVLVELALLLLRQKLLLHSLSPKVCRVRRIGLYAGTFLKCPVFDNIFFDSLKDIAFSWPLI